jgi:hypothetical protein
MTPKLQISTLFVYEANPWVSSTSGATYSGVPQKVFIIVWEFTNLERPKSDTFTTVSCLSLDSKIFSGYKRKHTHFLNNEKPWKRATEISNNIKVIISLVF